MMEESKVRELLLLAVQKAAMKEIDPAIVKNETDLRKDLGLDSLAMLETVWEIEERAGISIDESHLRTINTVGDVITLVQTLTSQKESGAAA
jgi:acyl carrier protein